MEILLNKNLLNYLINIVTKNYVSILFLSMFFFKKKGKKGYEYRVHPVYILEQGIHDIGVWICYVKMIKWISKEKWEKHYIYVYCLCSSLVKQ